VAIARALILEPEILLADEPTGNLDTETGKKIEEILVTLNRTKGITLIVVTHNQSLPPGCPGRSVCATEGYIPVNRKLFFACLSMLLVTVLCWPARGIAAENIRTSHSFLLKSTAMPPRATQNSGKRSTKASPRNF